MNVLLALLLLPFLAFANPGMAELEQQLFKDFGITISMKNDWIGHLNTMLAQCEYSSAYKHGATNALFSAYPALQTKIPYVCLGNLPTPVEKLETISNELGVKVYIKRDDLTGGSDNNGYALYGGNKVRKLEFLLAEAQTLGATKVLTFGCAGSNHAVATTVHAHRLGMDTICMLKRQPASRVVQRNLLMHAQYGAELHFNANNDMRKLNACMVWLEHYKKDGKAPYIIPTGGSNAIGTLGFVNAIFELQEQIKQGAMPKPTHIYVPCGSCATTAGMLLGCKAAGLDAQVVAIAVEPQETPTFAQSIDSLFKQTNQYLHSLDASFPELTYAENDLKIDLNFTGSDYGVFTQEGTMAADIVQKSSGIELEGTYTAKAFAGLLATAPKDSNAEILFWNTYCGLPMEGLHNKNYHQLPKVLHYYFDDAIMLQ